MSDEQRIAPEPDFDTAHKMQRLALDLAWRKYGHDAEYRERERLTNWLRDYGTAVWQLLQSELSTLRAALEAAEREIAMLHEQVRAARQDAPRALALEREENTALRQRLRELVAEWRKGPYLGMRLSWNCADQVEALLDPRAREEGKAEAERDIVVQNDPWNVQRLNEGTTDK